MSTHEHTKKVKLVWTFFVHLKVYIFRNV